MASACGFVALPTASRFSGRSRDHVGPPPLLPLADLDEELGRLCAPPGVGSASKPQPVSEGIVLRIQTTLRSVDNLAGRDERAAWWRRPRTYAILRTIDGLRFMDAFVERGWNDFFLPVHDADLPDFVRDEEGHPYRERFLSTQDYYLSQTKDIEQASMQHFTLPDGDSIFDHVRPLGQGGFGCVTESTPYGQARPSLTKSGSSVDCVQSTLSWKLYARKRVFKGGEAEHTKQAQDRLVSELKTLKGLVHQHLVKIVGSYTDTHYIAYIMTPVATLTLGQFLASKGRLGDDDMAMLRRFYGCLAAAVDYLHQSRVRHNDITRRNVLIERGEVYIADFGSCHSWNTQNPLGSRTRDVITGVSPDYMAPEIARPDSMGGHRGRPADMWSLGVLFLEMTTRLLGRSLEDLQASLRRSAARASKSGFLYAVPQFAVEWMQTLRRSSNMSQHDNEPLQWTRVLLQKNPKDRFKSHTLMNRILDSPSFNEFHCFKCHGEFVNIHSPRPDPEDDPQPTMDTAGCVPGGGDYFYRRAGASAPVVPSYSDQDTPDEEESAADAAASPSTSFEGFQADYDYERSMAAEKLLYGPRGQSSVPEHPQESPDRATEGSDPGSRFATTPPTLRDPDPTALFEEVESASSDESGEDEDDTRMFEEVSDKSESSSDVGSVRGADSNTLSDPEHDEPSSFGEEVDTPDGSTIMATAIGAGHGMFEEEEDASTSEPEEFPSEDDTTLGEGSSSGIMEASDQELGESSVEKPTHAVGTGGGEVALMRKLWVRQNPRSYPPRDPADGSEPRVDGQQHPEALLTAPSATAAEDLASQQPESPGSKPERQPDGTGVGDRTHEPLSSPQVVAPLALQPIIRFQQTLVRLRGQVNDEPEVMPSINVQPPDDGSKNQHQCIGPVASRSLDIVPPASPQPLSKKNLEKLAPKRSKSSDLVRQLNPAPFFKMTADNASVISDNTKKAIGGIGFPEKADKLKDFWSLRSSQSKEAVAQAWTKGVETARRSKSRGGSSAGSEVESTQRR